MIPELLKSISGSTVRWVLTGIGAVLVDRGVLLADDLQKLIAGAGLLGATLIWSYWQKYKSRILLLLGIDAAPGTPEEVIKQQAKSGGTFSVWSLLLLVSLVPVGLSVSCAKKGPDLPPAEEKARKTAIYTAQVYTAIYGWHRMTAVLADNSVIGDPKNHFVLNDQVTAGVDIVADRLKNGLPAEAFEKIKELLSDVDKAEESGLLGIKDEQGRAKYREVMFSVRFTLNSIKAVIDASKEPSLSEARRVATASVRAEGDAPWWTDAVLVAQETLIKLFEQSRFQSADEGWTDAANLSTTIHDANKARIGS